MRINVYAEEILLDTEIVEKVVTDEKFGTRTFYGVRMYLDSPESLHSDPADDDRSAITFWIPWTRARGHNVGHIQALLEMMNIDTDEILRRIVLGDGGPDLKDVVKP